MAAAMSVEKSIETISDFFKAIENCFDENLLLERNSLLKSIFINVKYLTSEIVKLSNRNEAFPDDGISVIIKALKYSDNLKNEIHIQLRTEIFRCLRNLCALGKHYQIKITKNSTLIPITKETVVFLLNRDYDYQELYYKPCLRCVIQFLGNLVVNNSENKKLIWFELKDVFSKLLSQSKDVTLINYVCMLIYNCLHEEQVIIQNLYDDSNLFFSINNSVIEIATENDIEWGLYILVELLDTDGYLWKLNNEFSNNKKLFVLEVIKQMLDDKKDKIHQSNILFLCEELKNNWNQILMAPETDCDKLEPTIIIKMLDILCSASTLDEYKELLQNDLELLSTVLYLLKSIHVLGKQSNNNFSPVVELSAVANPEKVTEDPVNGMKRDLVRLIGNLCWKCKRTQDHVRQLDGIPLLLDCCNIDARNPFIIQWVIFALRNLCENNLENQSVIRNMEKLNFVESDVLNELKIKINDEEVATTAKSKSETTDSRTMHRNLEDIEQLFK